MGGRLRGALDALMRIASSLFAPVFAHAFNLPVDGRHEALALPRP